MQNQPKTVETRVTTQELSKKKHNNRITWFFIEGLSTTYYRRLLFTKHPIAGAVWSKAWVCSRSLAEIVDSNAAGDMDVCLFWVLGVVKYRSLRRADHSIGGVLPNVMYLTVIVKPR
jgi:hypothetical protein